MLARLLWFVTVHAAANEHKCITALRRQYHNISWCSNWSHFIAKNWRWFRKQIVIAKLQPRNQMKQSVCGTMLPVIANYLS